MIKSLSYKQKLVFDYFVNFIKNYGHAPTYREASSFLWINPSVVFSHIKNIIKKWYLSSEGWSLHLIEVTDKVPLLWTVACWSPISVNEEILGYIDIPKSMMNSWNNFYALKARWESMKDAGIHDGDILIIRQQSDVDNGDIAVVILGEYEDDERATLKRVYKTPQAMILRPENDSFPTQIITWPSQIRGKLVSVIRNY